MRQTVFCILLSLLFTISMQAQSTVINNDSTGIPTLEEIIESESILSQKKANETHYKEIWKRNTFLNIVYGKEELSSEEFPSAKGPFSNEFKSALSLGLQSGRTYNLHKKPIGRVLFFGLDYTPLDLSFSKFDAEDIVPSSFMQNGQIPYAVPWHKEKYSLNYGMSLGPSVTLYPFTSIGKSATDNIRLQLFFHVGYRINGTLVKDKEADKKSQSTSALLWGHGSYTTWGACLSWNVLGVGYEVLNNGKLISYATGDYDTGKIDMKSRSGRIFLQFRF